MPYKIIEKKDLSPSTAAVFRVIDWILIALTLVVSLYVIVNFETYVSDMQNNKLTTEIYVLGIIITLLVLEGGRRTLGNVLPIVAIIAILYALFESELCVCDIAQVLGMTQTAVSHQLRVLKSNKLVKFRKEGKNVFYSLDDDHVRRIIDQGMEHLGE